MRVVLLCLLFALVLLGFILLGDAQPVCQNVVRVYNTTNPSLKSPGDVAIDSDGNVYIADYSNSRVVKMDTNNNVLWTYNTSYPSAVALDSHGNLYVGGSSPWGGGWVFKLDALSNIQAVYNTSNPRIGPSVRIALDSSDNLYISDPSYQRVIKLDASNNLLAVYNTTNPKLTANRGVALDSSGNVYITDLLNNRVVQMGPGNNVLMTYNTSTPNAVALDSKGNLVTTSAYGNVVFTRNSSSNVLLVYNTTNTPWGSMSYPTAVKLDSSGNVYIADTRSPGRVLVMSCAASPSTNAGSSVVPRGVQSYLLGITVLAVFVGTMLN
jgi:streptogramin lyase